jgi:hypothetical protein
MPTAVSLVRRCRDLELVIARLMDDSQVLRDENAELLVQLEAARRPFVVGGRVDRLEARPPVARAAPAAARPAPPRRFVVVADESDRLERTLPVGVATPATARPAPPRPLVVASQIDRFEATLPVNPAAPATARATLTRWLSGHVPMEVLDDARLLASELVNNSLLQPDISEEDLLRLAVQLTDGALRVEVRDPGTAEREPGPESSGVFGQLAEMIATRWGINCAVGTHAWFEVDAAGATG